VAVVDATWQLYMPRGICRCHIAVVDATWQLYMPRGSCRCHIAVVDATETIMLSQFLEVLTSWHKPLDPTGPARSSVVKRIFGEDGNEIDDVCRIKGDDKVLNRCDPLRSLPLSSCP